MGDVSFSVATVCLMRAKCKHVSPSSSWTLMLALERTRSSISAEWPWDTANSRGVCCRLLRISTSARFYPKNKPNIVSFIKIFSHICPVSKKIMLFLITFTCRNEKQVGNCNQGTIFHLEHFDWMQRAMEICQGKYDQYWYHDIQAKLGRCTCWHAC